MGQAFAKPLLSRFGCIRQTPMRMVVLSGSAVFPFLPLRRLAALTLCCVCSSPAFRFAALRSTISRFAVLTLYAAFVNLRRSVLRFRPNRRLGGCVLRDRGRAKGRRGGKRCGYTLWRRGLSYTCFYVSQERPDVTPRHTSPPIPAVRMCIARST